MEPTTAPLREADAAVSKTVTLRSGHHEVVFELTSDGLYLYTSCCGARVPRRKAKKLRKALTKWLAHKP